jgi:hypothetical protein
MAENSFSLQLGMPHQLMNLSTCKTAPAAILPLPAHAVALSVQIEAPGQLKYEISVKLNTQSHQ